MMSSATSSCSATTSEDGANGGLDHTPQVLFAKVHQFVDIYESAYSSFYLPVLLVINVCDILAPSSFHLASRIAVPLGEYFQLQETRLATSTRTSRSERSAPTSSTTSAKRPWLIDVALVPASTEQHKVARKDQRMKGRHFTTR